MLMVVLKNNPYMDQKKKQFWNQTNYNFKKIIWIIPYPRTPGRHFHWRSRGQSYKQCFSFQANFWTNWKMNQKESDEKPKYHLYTHEADMKNRAYVYREVGFIIYVLQY